MDDAFDINAWSSYWHALSKDCPGKLWWRARANHQFMFDSLGISAGDHGAVYACAPFRTCRIDGKLTVVAAYPSPRLLDDPDHHWLGIEVVLAWAPDADKAVVVGDPSPQIVGNLSDQTNVIFASPLAFFRHWARRRAQFLTMRQEAAAQRWNKAPAEGDETPGALMIGAPADIRWRPSEMPTDIKCAGISPAVINRELLKAARLPRAFGGEQ